MQESELSEPVCEWLQGRGLVAYCEVPVQGTCVDIIATGSALVVAVELKVSLSRKVIRQAMLAQNFADEAWCAVPTKPKSLKTPKMLGLGVLRVRAGGVVVILEANSIAYKPFFAAREEVKRRLAVREPGGIGGVETPYGDGPAQEVARLVAPLHKARTPWREIWSRVPNHYCSPKSMQSVMLGYGPARRIIMDGGGEAEKGEA